jgi:hypothetical protein
VICLYGFVIFSATLVLAHGHRRLYGPRFVSAALWSVFAVGVLNAAVQIAVLANEQLSAAVYGWVNISEDSATHISQGYRSPGLFSSGAAILGTFNALTLTIGLASLLDGGARARWRLILLVAAATVLQFVAIAISGRTGFVALAIGLAFLSLRQLRLDRTVRKDRTGMKLVLCIAAFLLGGLTYFGIDSIEENLRWSFEFVYSLLEGEGLKTESTSILFEQMFFLPDGPIDLLLGVQNFGRNAALGLIDSDAGYIQLVFGSGLLGMGIAMSGFVYILVQALKGRGHSILSMLLTAFVTIILVVNVKDFYYFQNSGVTQVVLFCFALLLVERQQRRPRALRSRGQATPIRHYSANSHPGLRHAQ